MSPPRAPELSAKLDWLNADPQSLAAHRGRSVLLLFWNAASVYCHNALQELQKLQRKHPDALSVLAIHVPKFTAELEPRMLQDAINRLGIEVPVGNDREWTVWQHYGIASWPTAVLIDADGVRVADFTGDDRMSGIEAVFNEHGPMQPPPAKPKALQVKSRNKGFGTLHSPCGLAMHKGLLYIVDAGHNRILECGTDGVVKRVFGNGLPLFLDGLASEASFNRPMAVSVNREYLYVADTGNHAVRRVNLLHGSVDTLIGNGQPGRADDGTVGSHHDIQLNRPTSLYVHQDTLVICEAGNNGLSMVNLASREFSRLVGGGGFGLLDGVGDRARMAHPLGLSGSRNYLYVAEGGSSSIRTVAVPEGRVNTLVGSGLYQFGSADGLRPQAALQHPCALAVDEKRGLVWIADAYNRKIRAMDILGNRLSTLSLMQPLLHPCGLAIDAESLWIADSASSHIHRYFFESEYLSRISIQMA